MSSPVADKPVRKFPPPCWSQAETLALIDAYRERWLALRRGYLRTADWDAVAAVVASRFPNASPAKTSAQCRHKMEKLRQRYRAEKQRSLSYPGRFFSSWFFFENMEFMEPYAGPKQETDDHNDYGNGSTLKPSIDHNLMPLGLNSKINKKIDGDLTTNHGLDIDFVHQNSMPFEIRTKNYTKNGRTSPDFGARALNGCSMYADTENYPDHDGANPIFKGVKLKKSGKIYGKIRPGIDFDHDGAENFNVGDGFNTKSSFDQEFKPSVSRGKKFGKAHRKFNPHFDGDYDKIHGDGDVWVKLPRSRNLGKSDSMFPNGVSPMSGLGFKRGRDLMEEMVSSIRVLGEGFMKMEKMKMEMAMEIEKMRMEMEMKRNELMLESQQQIVDSFVKALLENNQTVNL